ncbi:fungal hydrophobin [Trametes gibbosa]|nr:fungal hydrophobin [Trametes gibbosa]
MFSQVVVLAAIPSMPILATATALKARGGAPSCTTGAIQCCDSTETAGSAAGVALLGLLGIVLQDLTVLLGVNCSPISVIGVGGGTCDAQTVCCEDNSHGGLVSIGCLPVTL